MGKIEVIDKKIVLTYEVELCMRRKIQERESMNSFGN